MAVSRRPPSSSTAVVRRCPRVPQPSSAVAAVHELSCKIMKKAAQLYVDFTVWQPRLDNIT